MCVLVYEAAPGLIFRGIIHAGLPSAHRGMKMGVGSAEVTRLLAVAEDGFPPRIVVRGDVLSRE